MPITINSVPPRIFAGFLPATVSMQRKDVNIVAITEGSGGLAQLELEHISENLTLDIAQNDIIFYTTDGGEYYGAYSVAQYFVSGGVGYITAGLYTVDAGAGYMNYKKNWHVSIEFMNADFPTIPLLPYKLLFVGDEAGLVQADLRAINDLNGLAYYPAGGVSVEGRTKFKFRYYENWLGGSFLVDTWPDKFICFYAATTVTDETIPNAISLPKYWEGYPAAIGLLYSDIGKETYFVKCDFDELDLNRVTITSANELITFPNGAYGMLLAGAANIPIEFDANTALIRVNYKKELLT